MVPVPHPVGGALPSGDLQVYQCITLSRSPFGLHKLWPTLVHVHIATEVLVTLHPGTIGLCFMIKVWLVTFHLVLPTSQR